MHHKPLEESQPQEAQQSGELTPGKASATAGIVSHGCIWISLKSVGRPQQMRIWYYDVFGPG